MLSCKTRIIIVDDNIDFSYVLSEYLAGFEEFEIVGTANNGHLAVELIQEKEPDVVILDLVMPETDGFGVLEKYTNTKNKPQFIMLSAFGQDKTIQLALSLGADFFILKPFDMNDLVLRIKQLQSMRNAPNLINNYGEDKPEISIEDRIDRILKEIGVLSHLKGYKYLKHAVKMVLNDFSAVNSITKFIYSGIAKEYNTTGSRVERAIRNAIEICWYKGNLKTIENIFNFKCSENNIRPTNSEFIITIVEQLRKR
ncbi:MAG: sporulation transcription factor Spo0A [Eubacteriales bacterium]